MANNIQFTWNGGRLTPQIRQAAQRGLYEGAELILAKSKDIVPHASGDLQRSGHVSPPMPADIIHITYDTPYARKQHEDLNLRHPDPTNPISSSGRTAKYLERPFNEMRNDVYRRIQDKIQRVLR